MLPFESTRELAPLQRSLAELLPPGSMGHGRLSFGASFRARLVVFPAFGSVQRRSEKNTRPPLPVFVIH